MWGYECLEIVQGNVLYHVVSNLKANEDELQSYFDESNGGDQEQALRNLSNSCHNEFVINDPIEGMQPLKRTAKWRISMAYYGIYKVFSVPCGRSSTISLQMVKMESKSVCRKSTDRRCLTNSLTHCTCIRSYTSQKGISRTTGSIGLHPILTGMADPPISTQI